ANRHLIEVEERVLADQMVLANGFKLRRTSKNGPILAGNVVQEARLKSRLTIDDSHCPHAHQNMLLTVLIDQLVVVERGSCEIEGLTQRAAGMELLNADLHEAHVRRNLEPLDRLLAAPQGLPIIVQPGQQPAAAILAVRDLGVPSVLG